ncbi:MAG: DUF4190 domain-containing protein [Chthoniobacterales bacterium]
MQKPPPLPEDDLSAASEQEPRSVLAHLAFVLGLLAVTIFGPITGIFAILFGHLARYKLRAFKNSRAYKNATWGLWMGYVSVALIALLAGLLLILYKQLGTYGPELLDMLQSL